MNQDYCLYLLISLRMEHFKVVVGLSIGLFILHHAIESLTGTLSLLICIILPTNVILLLVVAIR